MHLDLWQTLAGLLVGIMVGVTGMGGGALLTPILILLFGINPGTAVSSDLLTSLVMRPIGGVVHVRRKTVEWGLVGWLALGSVPAGFSGVLILRALGNGAQVSHDVELAIAWALIVAVAALVAKTVLARRAASTDGDARPLRVRPLATVAIGVVGGVMVGMTSVGSGSLMMVLLLALYPTLTTKRLVGTDLVQAVPLIAAATLGHALYGHISIGVTASLLLGSIPGVYAGARLVGPRSGCHHQAGPGRGPVGDGPEVARVGHVDRALDRGGGGWGRPSGVAGATPVRLAEPAGEAHGATGSDRLDRRSAPWPSGARVPPRLHCGPLPSPKDSAEDIRRASGHRSGPAGPA